jgi:hypothetical protein
MVFVVWHHFLNGGQGFTKTMTSTGKLGAAMMGVTQVGLLAKAVSVSNSIKVPPPDCETLVMV